MSRIGNNPIKLPKNVTLEIAANAVNVKGPKGTLSQQIDSDIKISVKDEMIVVERPTDQKRHRSLHGLYRALLNNMVIGVSEGYTKQLELVGVGYKVAVAGGVVELNLGYSHNIFFVLPSEITATAVNEKGKNPTLILQGIDKQLIGQVAAKIKSLRKVEPYKGKGVKFTNEVIRRKAGKTAAKK